MIHSNTSELLYSIHNCSIVPIEINGFFSFFFYLIFLFIGVAQNGNDYQSSFL